MIIVNHFIRKARPTGNYSVEFIFEDVRNYLEGRVQFNVFYMPHLSNGFIKRIQNIFYCFRNAGNVNHVTGDIHYVNYLIKRDTNILTILDCLPMNSSSRLKRLVFKWIWLKIPVYKSRYITTISESTRQDVIRYTNCDPSKVIVIPVAISKEFKPSPKVFNKECPVLLQVGTASNKNLQRLISALAGIHCRLIIIGKLQVHILKLLEDHQVLFENKINLTQLEIIRMYEECDIVTFISTFEGFGMPIIEANTIERPVIAGNSSSMPEVGSNAAYYVNAFSIEEIRKGILELIENADLREKLITNGRINRKRFSGESIAEMYYDLYREVWEQTAV